MIESGAAGRRPFSSDAGLWNAAETSSRNWNDYLKKINNLIKQIIPAC